MSAVTPAPKVLYAEFTALPGCEDAVAELLAGLTDDVRREPGCIEFAPYQVSTEPSRFFVYEVYRDDDAFTEHINAPYGRVFNDQLAPLIVEAGSQLTWLQPLSS